MSESTTEAPASKPVGVNDKIYEFLRMLVQLILPAAATFYGSLGHIWGLPYVEQVVATLTASALFVGVLVVVFRRIYTNSDDRFDGVAHITEDEDGMKHASLVLKNYEDPSQVVNQSEIRFKVEGS